MDWKNVTWKSVWKISKEKLIFVFCSGLLLFALSLPGESDSMVEEKAELRSEEHVPVGNTEEGTVDAEVSASGKSAGEELSYEAMLERKIQTILKGVDGVGAVDVMIVLKSSEEKVLHVDKTTSVSTTEEQSGGTVTRTQTQQQYSEATVTGGKTSVPIIEKELFPELSGIIISADGGGSALIKTEISEAMEALFGLPPHKIKVLKRVKEGV